MDLDLLSVNTIRFLAVDAVQRANSGHPGLPMGAAPMGYALWTRHLKHDPADPTWFDRDRFVLSAGHGSMLLYALLHLTGYDLSLDDLRHFRRWGSRTPGHPERGVTPGAEVTTGPLGQGFANAVGMAMAEAHLAARFNRPGLSVIDHFVYAIASDGDLMEGVAAEAASLAGHLCLGKLIVLYDDNRISLAASTDLTFTEDRAARFAAYGWHTQVVEEGTDVAAIDRALISARAEAARPSLILVRTHIGHGSPHKQDSFEAHWAPLGEEEVRQTKHNLGWPLEPEFYVPDEVRTHFRTALSRGAEQHEAWLSELKAYREAWPEEARELDQSLSGALPVGWEESLPSFAADSKGMATRVACGEALAAVAPRLPSLLGGSADLDPSTHSALRDLGDVGCPQKPPEDTQGMSGGAWGYGARNIHFGVREHAMGSVLNGLAAHGGTIPYGATFLIFSDYMRPPIRLAALMRLGVIYIFTHDSIAVGEDGPTHQPVEQLANLRAVPGLIVIRPADANEVSAALRVAIESRQAPVALILSRQNLPVLDREVLGPAQGLRRGAYILAEAEVLPPHLVLVASGSEVGLALAVRDRLAAGEVHARVVSMPSWDLFDLEPTEYRESVLPRSVRVKVAIEAAGMQGWERYLGESGMAIGVEEFGASAPGDVVLKEFGFDAGAVTKRVLALLRGPGGLAPG
jgi:transketolase